MRRVIVVVFEGVQTLDATGPAEVFAAAGRVRGKPAYDVVFAATARATATVTDGEGGPIVVTTSAQLTMQAIDITTLRPRPTDVVVVSGGDDHPVDVAAHDPALVDWLRRAAPVVSRMSSVCSGAFILAAAGLLDGKRATTHWIACKQLAAMFPAVRVDGNAIFIRDGSTWTSAGVTTGIDMALAMVEDDHGQGLADAVAARLVLYARRPGFQSQFSDALVAQTEKSDPLGAAIAWARAHLDEADVETFAKHAGLSARTLHRRCLDTLGTTPAKLLNKLRVEHARNLLETSQLAVKTLAARCGFGNSVRMKRAFERELGIQPRDYRMLHANA